MIVYKHKTSPELKKGLQPKPKNELDADAIVIEMRFDVSRFTSHNQNPLRKVEKKESKVINYRRK